MAAGRDGESASNIAYRSLTLTGAYVDRHKDVPTGQDGRVRFEINLESAQLARIRISSQSLKLGTIVHSEE